MQLGSVGNPLKRLESPSGEAVGFYGFSQRRMRSFIGRMWGELFAITGARNVPQQGSAVLAINQTTHLDPLFLAVALRRPVHFVGLDDEGALEPWYTPLLYRSMGVIRVTDNLVKRGSRRFRAEVDAAVRYGELIGIFPEGRLELKRNRRDIMPFCNGALAIARRHRLPIIPVLIRGTEEVMPHSTAHLRGKVRVSPVTVMIGNRIHPADLCDSESIRRAVAGLEMTAALA